MANVSETLTKPGQIILDICDIVRIDGMKADIHPQFRTVSITEDMFSNFIYGELTVVDAQNLRNVFPFSGRERLHLKYHVPSSKDYVEGWFYIRSVDDPLPANDRTLVYTIHFVSPEMVLDTQEKISRKISGKPSITITRLLEMDLNTEKTVEIDESTYETSFIANFWKPTQCIQYIAESTLNDKECPDYVFFETLRNGFKFKSLSSFITEGNSGNKVAYLYEFNKHESQPTQDGKQTQSLSLDREYSKLLKFDDMSRFDYLERVNSGYYGGRVMSYDANIRRYTLHNREREWDKDPHLNKYSPIMKDAPSAKDAMMMMYFKNYQNLDDASETSTYSYTVQRQTLFSRLKSSCVIGQVYGHTRYEVGQKAFLRITKSSQIKNSIAKAEDVYDELLTGVYLITSIKHEIINGIMLDTIEFMKDSFIVNMDDTYKATQLAEAESK